MRHRKGQGQCRLVLGVSSVGKSTFIRRLIDSKTLPAETTVTMAYELDGDARPVIETPWIVHYNVLRPVENRVDLFPASIMRDKVAGYLFGGGLVSSADILVARRSTLVKRVLLRDAIETELRDDFAPYPNTEIFEILSRISLSEIYEPWIAILSERGIPMHFYSTDDSEPVRLASREDAMNILNSDEPVTYLPEEAQQALSHFSFPYQAPDGKERTATLATISPHLEGTSAIDIGCAEGFFCFSLEKRGFNKVVGTDIKRDRFLAACAMRDVSASRCEFRLQDVMADPPDGMFDIVLLLNVLHHLQDPVHALHMLARLARRKVILEYPTLSDPKFTETLTHPVPDIDGLPLIGVSSLVDQDQTFVFSDSALKRICLENSKLFRKMTFIQSPIAPSRRIAICEV